MLLVYIYLFLKDSKQPSLVPLIKYTLKDYRAVLIVLVFLSLSTKIEVPALSSLYISQLKQLLGDSDKAVGSE